VRSLYLDQYRKIEKPKGQKLLAEKILQKIAKPLEGQKHHLLACDI